MLHINYKIEAIDELLKEDCILARMYPLIPYKCALIDYFRMTGCFTKSDCLKIQDDALLSSCLPDIEMVKLFKKFLVMYDIKPQKLKEIDTVCKTTEEAEAFRELYHLPGVKRIRANLYYRSGFRSLKDIASSSLEEIMSKTAETIRNENLNCIVPLEKEIKTHIAVAKAFTYYCAD